MHRRTAAGGISHASEQHDILLADGLKANHRVSEIQPRRSLLKTVLVCILVTLFFSALISAIAIFSHKSERWFAPPEPRRAVMMPAQPTWVPELINKVHADFASRFGPPKKPSGEASSASSTFSDLKNTPLAKKLKDIVRGRGHVDDTTDGGETRGRGDGQRWAYATFLSGRKYMPAVLVMLRSLRASGSQQLPVLVLVLENTLAVEDVDLLLRHGCEVVQVPPIALPSSTKQVSYLKTVCAKFHLWNQTQYDKLLFIDADIVVFKPIDHLFDMIPDGGAPDAPLLAASIDDPLVNTGFMVLRTHELIYQGLIQMLESEVYPYHQQSQATVSLLLRDYIVLLPCDAQVMSLQWDPWRLGFVCMESEGTLTTTPLSDIHVLHWVSYPKPWIAFDIKQAWRYNLIYYLYYVELRFLLGPNFWDYSKCLQKDDITVRCSDVLLK